MAFLDSFYDLGTKARKDPLGHSYLNGVLNNQDVLTRMFGVEHYLSSDVGTAGEHNAREIPRAAAVLTATGGPPPTSYSVANPDGYLTLASTPAAGDCRLTLASGQGTTGKMMVQLQSYLPSTFSTLYAPRMWAKIESATDIRVYSQAAFAAGGPADITEIHDFPYRYDFGILVYSEATQDGAMANALASAARRGIGLRQAAIWNKIVQRDGDLRALIGTAHDPDTGEHDDLRIARYMGHVTWDGASYDAPQDQNIGPTGTDAVLSVTRLAQGQVRIELDAAPSGSVFAPFVTMDYGRTNGGDPAPDAILTSRCPSDMFDSNIFDVYLYKWDPNGPYWNYVDTDFFFSVHYG